MQQPIHVTEDELIAFLSGTSNPSFVSEVSEEELVELRSALEELASFLNLGDKIEAARIKNSIKMGTSTDMMGSPSFVDMLEEWGFVPVPDTPEQIPMDFESPLPGFARKAYDGILEPMVVLQTRDGQCVGNAIVTEVRFDTNNGDVLVTVCTDACNMVIYSLDEVEQRFHKPKWVAKGFINENVRQRVKRYYMGD